MKNINDFKLTKREIKIAKIQSALKHLGYQWQEHQYNDGYDEVYIEITKNTSPTAFSDKNEINPGWGRMGRLRAWTLAYEWAVNEAYKEKTR